MSNNAELSLTKRDLKLARLIFAGLSCDDIGATVGLSGRMVRFIARGEKRPGVKAQVDCLRRDVQRQEANKLLRARLMALDRLTEALNAARPDGTPDYGIRVRAATVLRTRQDEADKGTSEAGNDIDEHFVGRITSTIDKVIKDHPRLCEGIRGGRWANTHNVGSNGPVDRHR